MASGGHEMDFNKETEYNTRLYKAIVNPFVHCIPAVALTERSCISKLLTVADMDKVKKTDDRDGQNASARTLLDFLRMKPKWFDAFMEALDDPSLKLEEVKPKFLREKAKVDEEWRREHPHGSRRVTTLGLDEASFQGPVPDTAGRRQQPQNDFDLPSPLQVSNAEVGLQRDAEEETGLERPSSDSDIAQRMANMVVSQEQARTVRHSQSYPGVPDASSGASGSHEDYTDATSNKYDPLGSPSDPSQYDQLNGRGLQVDASPEAVQESGIPEPEVGVVAEPQVHGPHRRPQTREDHPSLRVAISRDIRKDFEPGFVQGELSTLPGWKNHQEEHEVIRLVRPNRRIEGLYVIWYWALAKRPTICVVVRGKVITFVVHRSASQPSKYYINRRQKRSTSLRELMTYHLLSGILYKPPNENETTVWLLNPVA